MDYLIKIGTGIVSGVSYSLLGFGKSKGESFDFMKFGTTVVLGAAAGFLNGLLDMPLNQGTDYLMNFGFVGIVENVIKTLIRRLSKKK